MKVYAPNVIDALAECLRTVYWYVPDQRSFFVRCGVPNDVIARLPWDQYKRHIARALVDDLASQGVAGKPVLDRLIGGVVEQDEDFPQLARLKDGKTKAAEARKAARHLKDLLGAQATTERIEQAKKENRTEAERARLQRQERATSLKQLHDEFMTMSSLSNPTQAQLQSRGYEFQRWLQRLFALHDLDPRSSFGKAGEQIDGSILLRGNRTLVEARWTKDQTEPKEVRDFEGKVETGKHATTMGLMVSVAGFTEGAQKQPEKRGRLLTILMDGADLMPVVLGMVDLRALLERKLDHASEGGGAMGRWT